MTVDAHISEELKPYARLVEFLGLILGRNCEVLLHDCSDFSHSIVALANSQVSGRIIGGPATDLVLRIWKSKQYETTDYLTNYVSYSNSGKKFRSSTFFIRNAAGSVIAFLCINQDDGPLIEATKLMNDYLDSLGDPHRHEASPATNTKDDENTVIGENLSVSVDELTQTRIQSLAAAHHLDPHRLSREERATFISELDNAGIFLLKGAIEKTATALGISQPTVYRYLRESRKMQVRHIADKTN